MQHNSYRRWITLAIISFSGGVSFDLAYLGDAANLLI